MFKSLLKQAPWCGGSTEVGMVGRKTVQAVRERGGQGWQKQTKKSPETNHNRFMCHFKKVGFNPKGDGAALKDYCSYCFNSTPVYRTEYLPLWIPLSCGKNLPECLASPHDQLFKVFLLQLALITAEKKLLRSRLSHPVSMLSPHLLTLPVIYISRLKEQRSFCSRQG